MLVGRGIDGITHVFEGRPRAFLQAEADVKIAGTEAVGSAVAGDDDVRFVGGDKKIPLKIFRVDGGP